MSDQGEDAARDHEDAFRARFPLDAFEPIARALYKSASPDSLNGPRDWLLPYFDAFASSARLSERSPAEQKRSLEQLRKAAGDLLKSLESDQLSIHRTWEAVRAARDQQFKVTVQRLADEAERKIEKLSKPGRTGRPVKNAAFRELTPDLVHVYEHIVEAEAQKPSWRHDSGMYGGAFYHFAVAVWRCLYNRLPAVRGALPQSEAALGQELKNHWPKDHAATR